MNTGIEVSGHVAVATSHYEMDGGDEDIYKIIEQLQEAEKKLEENTRAHEKRAEALRELSVAPELISDPDQLGLNLLTISGTNGEKSKLPQQAQDFFLDLMENASILTQLAKLPYRHLFGYQRGGEEKEIAFAPARKIAANAFNNLRNLFSTLEQSLSS